MQFLFYNFNKELCLYIYVLYLSIGLVIYEICILEGYITLKILNFLKKVCKINTPELYFVSNLQSAENTMKNLLFMIFMLLIISPFLASQNNVNDMDSNERILKGRGISYFGMQLAGNHEVSVGGLSGSTPVNIGVSFGADFLYAFIPNLEFGVGIEYQFPRQQTLYIGNFHFSPLYAVTRIPFSLPGIEIYGIGKVGYNFFFGDTDYFGFYSPSGGFFFQVGGGIGITAATFELLRAYYFPMIQALYTSNSGSASYSTSTIDVRYSCLSIYIGLISKF